MVIEWVIVISVMVVAIYLARPLIIKLGDAIDGPED